MKRSRNIFGILVLALATALSPNAINAQTPIESAKALFNQGRYSDAKDILRTETSKSSSNAEAYYWLGRCEFELYNNDGAVTNAERAVELESNNSEYHYFLGTAAGHKAETANWFNGLALAKKTQSEFAKAVQLDPHNLDAQRDLISYYLAAPGVAGGGDDKAEAQIAKLKQISPLQAQLAQMELFENKKKWTQAIEVANAILSSKPKEARPYLEIAEYFQNREEYSEMRDALAAIPAGAVSDPHVNYYRGVADVIAEERPAEAETLLKGYLNKVPPPSREDHAPLSSVHTWLGRLYEKNGRRQEAAAEYRIAVKMEPRDKFAHEGLKRTGS